MNIEELKEREQLLNAQLIEAQGRYNQAIADVNAISGAIQEVMFWIDRIEKSNIED